MHTASCHNLHVCINTESCTLLTLIIFCGNVADDMPGFHVIYSSRNSNHFVSDRQPRVTKSMTWHGNDALEIIINLLVNNTSDVTNHYSIIHTK